MSHVVVRVVESDDQTLILRYSSTLGHLVIQKQEDEVELVLQVAEDLPQDVRQNLMHVPADGDEAASPGWEGPQHVRQREWFVGCGRETQALGWRNHSWTDA
jgi:hypothetical protein